MRKAQSSKYLLLCQILGMVLILFALSFAAKKALAFTDNLNPNLGSKMCQPAIGIAATEARKFVMTGELDNYKHLKHIIIVLMILLGQRLGWGPATERDMGLEAAIRLPTRVFS